MLRSLHIKLVLIMILLVVCLMAIAGAFLINSVNRFYLNEFYTQMVEVFSEDTEFVRDLVTAREGVSVNFQGTQEQISRDMLKSWLKQGEDGTYSFDESVVKPVVIGWSEKYNTYGKPRDFQTSGGYTVHLTTGDYGWRVWQDKTTEALMQVLNAGSFSKISTKPSG